MVGYGLEKFARGNVLRNFHDVLTRFDAIIIGNFALFLPSQ